MVVQSVIRFIVTALLVLTALFWVVSPARAQTPTPVPDSPASGSPPATGAPDAQTPAVVIPLVDPTLAARAPAPPSGFTLIDAARGAWLFRKNYANGSPDFVQLINLAEGAHVALLHGDLTEARPEKGSYGGPDPRMKSPAIETYWRNVSTANSLAFCVINGGFFYMPEYPTRLAFPLKVDGEMVTEGWGIETYENQKLILELWDDKVEIRPLSKESLYGSTAPNILGGLSEEANKRIKYAVGRTFVGIADRDANGDYETLLILSTRTALQSGAAAVLREFGAGKVMMLDGGGSTQLLCRSGHHVRSDRPIPQAVAIFSGAPPQIEAELVQASNWQAILEGERPRVLLELRNTGARTWTESTTQFIIDPSMAAVAQRLPMPHSVSPGATAVISATLPVLDEAGLHTVEFFWQVKDETEAFRGSLLELNAVVLPAYMVDRLPALQHELEAWSMPGGQPATRHAVEARLQSWLAKNAPTATAEVAFPATDLSTPRIDPNNVILIPALMLPVILILGLLLVRRNSQ